jgi:hypothetical protein
MFLWERESEMTKAHLLAIALLASSTTLALAFDINGVWICTSVCLCGEHPGPEKTTHVAQTIPANVFTFTNECGIAVGGNLDAATGLITIPTWNTTAIPSPDEKTLTFGNGTIWSFRSRQ